MQIKNKITVVFITVIMTVFFLSPFGGPYSLAAETLSEPEQAAEAAESENTRERKDEENPAQPEKAGQPEKAEKTEAEKGITGGAAESTDEKSESTDEGETKEAGSSGEEFEKVEEEESEQADGTKEAGTETEGTETKEATPDSTISGNGIPENKMLPEKEAEEIKISFWTKDEADKEYLLDTATPDKEGHVDFPPVPARPGLLFAGWQAEGMERVTPHAVFGNSMNLYASFIPDFEKAGKERAVSYRLANVRTSIGISTTKPQAGQSNTYTYTGGMQTFTVPETGWYNIYCYGAQGGMGGTDSGNFGELSGYSSLEAGKKGTLRANQAYLKKGQALQICVGQEPGKGSISVGEGSTNGNKWQTSLKDYVDGYATCSHTSGFPGGWDMYRGYPDGEFGGQADTICDNDKGHSGGAVGGGGGGSSYVMANGIKIISAAGGNGGAAYYKCPDGNGTVAGGKGGGVTTVAGTANVTWTNGINTTTTQARSGPGQVVITVYRVIPQVALSVPTDWTNQDVTITAAATSTGAGLSEEAYCWGMKDETGNILWEQDEEGNELFTAAAEYGVSQNGTYACKIRDTAGNTGWAEITVTNIDKLSPAGEIAADTAWTKENVLLTVTGNDIEETAEYGKSGLQTEAYCWGKVDEFGNMQWEQAEEKGGKEPEGEEPEGEELTPETPGLSAEGKKTGETPTELTDTLKWTAAAEYTASQNGTYACKIRDTAGNITKISFTVKNIDRTAPEITYEKEGKWYEGEMKVTFSARDIQPDGTPGCGLDEAAYSFDGNLFSSQNRKIIKEEGVYSIWVRDRLGNQSKHSFFMEHDKKKRKKEDGKKSLVTLPEIKERESDRNGEKKKPESGDEKEALAVSWENDKKMREGEAVKPEEITTQVQKLPVTQAERVEPVKEVEKKEDINREKRKGKIGKIVLYSAWLMAVLCGLLWLLLSLLLEHVIVYEKKEKGKYQRAGICAIIRKKEYKQINLLPYMEPGKEKEYKIKFGMFFVWLYGKDKVLIRTSRGVLLRNVAREIEIRKDVSDK